MQIFAVILNWNKAALTQRCLTIAQRSTALPVQWVVVDNGSDPAFSAGAENVKVIRNDANLGFTGGANIGMRHAFDNGADLVWLLNNDAEPLEGALEALVAAVENQRNIGLASSAILDSSDGIRIDWHGTRFIDGIYHTTTDPTEYARWETETPKDICLVGTSLLVTRQLIERVGYLDDRLFAYWEDMDFSRRSLNAGFKNIVVPQSVIRHPSLPVAAAARPPYYGYYMARNELLVSRKLRDPLRSRYWAIRRILRWQARPGLSSLQRKAIRQGLVHGLLGRSGPLK